MKTVIGKAAADFFEDSGEVSEEFVGKLENCSSRMEVKVVVESYFPDFEYWEYLYSAIIDELCK